MILNNIGRTITISSQMDSTFIRSLVVIPVMKWIIGWWGWSDYGDDCACRRNPTFFERRYDGTTKDTCDCYGFVIDRKRMSACRGQSRHSCIYLLRDCWIDNKSKEWRVSYHPARWSSCVCNFNSIHHKNCSFIPNWEATVHWRVCNN